MFGRPRLQGPYFVSASTVVAVGLGVLLYLAISTSRDSARIQERGLAACVEAGHQSEACVEAADRNHRTCMNYTFTRASKRSGNEVFDSAGYVACVLDGPAAYREAEHTKRKAAAASGNSAALR